MDSALGYHRYVVLEKFNVHYSNACFNFVVRYFERGFFCKAEGFL